MNLQLERRIQVNLWLSKARWLYVFGLAIIGILTNIVGRGEYVFPWDTMMVLFIIGCSVNIWIYLAAKKLQETKSPKTAFWLSYFQIFFELSVLLVILHFSGTLESMVFIFLVLPIVSASILFGPRGSIITALAASFFLWGLLLAEHFEIISHVNRYGVVTVFYTNFQIVLINALNVAFFYVILGIFSGYVSKILISREEDLKKQTQELEKEKEKREKELLKLDKATGLLMEREGELIRINKEYDKKIKELEQSQISMLKAFNDLQKERKRAEEEKNKTASIISNFMDPIILLDKESRISLYNPSAASIFLLDESDLGKTISKNNNYSMNNFKSIILNNYQVEKPKTAADKNEEEITISYRKQKQFYKVKTATVTDSQGRYFGTMKIFYNFTREKMVDRLKSEFISIAAHQLRTPLSAIKWAIKMILDGDVGKLNKDQEQLLFKGYESNERIIKLVNDMLNVSRIEEGRFGYNYKEADLPKILSNLLDSLKNKIKEKKIKISLKVPAKLPLVKIDEEKIFLVLENLLENAIKYSSIGGAIEVTVRKVKYYLSVAIKDYGVGIPKKDREKLFTKFFRADNVVKMQTEGSGLGLFIVKNIIEKHKGEIAITSEEEKGTEVVFTLPIKSHK